MPEERTVIIISQSLRTSVVMDACTYIVVVAVIGTGFWLGSAAMQWFGFVMLCICAMNIANKLSKRMTPQEAADLLREKFGVRA